jgi:putative phage-type endonuclease
MTAAARLDLINIEQGSQEWLALRKTKVTATDANIVMGASHWKTKLQLYHEKLSDEPAAPPNERMKRGTDLEPIARELFCIDTGIYMVPRVIVKDWAMASLDGISEDNEILEIKCPGEKDHAIALAGKVPDHYYPQLQFQMYVADAKRVYYYSFDGFQGVTVVVERDDEYIAAMVERAKWFYGCMINKTPPERDEDEYVERDDDVWEECVAKWKITSADIKRLESQEDELRKKLIFLSGEQNTKGSGISLCQVQRKGNVDYAKVPQLKGIDLEPYRKPSTTSWRITCV